MVPDVLQAPHSSAPPVPEPYGRQSTRLGAGLGIAGVVLIVAGFALIAPAGATVTSTAGEIAAFYRGSGVTRVLTGGLLECAGFLLLLAFTTMLTGRLRGAGATGELLPDTARLAAAAYVTVCLVPGMSSGAVALWLASRSTPDEDLLVGPERPARVQLLHRPALPGRVPRARGQLGGRLPAAPPLGGLVRHRHRRPPGGHGARRHDRDPRPARAARLRLGRRGGGRPPAAPGPGSGPLRRGAGAGLDTMRERAEELGGSLAVLPRDGGGTVVRAVLPREPV